MSYPFLKGHGTENDFVVLPDPDGSIHGDADGEMAEERVRALCDRRAGLGSVASYPADPRACWGRR